MADAQRIYLRVVSEFGGSIPDVPTAPGVNVDELTAGDPEKPFYVTLPIIPQIGAVSGNGVLYDEALAQRIITQINTKRPGALFGHIAEEQRGRAFPHPEAFWVGATRNGNAAWAKAYVPAGAAREHLRLLKAVGGQISTSIYGMGLFEPVSDGVDRIVDFDLETLDFAPPERAALGYGAPVRVTAEMQDDPPEDDPPAESETEPNMGEDNKQPVVTMETVSDELRRQIIAEHERETGQKKRVEELESALQARDARVAELEAAEQKRRVAEFGQRVEKKIAELTDWTVKSDEGKTKLAALRKNLARQVTAHMGDSTDVSELQEAINTVWADMEPIAESVRDQLAGPGAVVGSRARGERRQFEDTPEARAKARSRAGF